ncbi:hypothetical protein WJX74_009831 [Apatococcus lobatus]|uniref:Uncharacterized protein n=1 Tax=Apatococcus lobatus TaxID=904363 RepID=A0AAW1QCU8_9CHLO
MVRVKQPSKQRCPQLEDDIAVQVLAKLPCLRDKLAFGSACKASRRALLDPRCWELVNVTEAVWFIGKYYSPQQVFSALVPKMTNIRVLEGSSLSITGSRLGRFQQLQETDIHHCRGEPTFQLL